MQTCREPRRRRATKGNKYLKTELLVFVLEGICGVHFWRMPVHLDIYVCYLDHFGADSGRHSGALWDVGSWAPRLHGPCQMALGPTCPVPLDPGLRPRLHGPRPCGTHGPRPRRPGIAWSQGECTRFTWAKVPLCRDPPLTRLHGCGS